MHRRIALLLPASTLGVLLGCPLRTEPIVCTLEARPSISVFVRDSVSDQLIASGTTLILTDGAFVDSTTVPAADPTRDPYPVTTEQTYERPGRYHVTVRRAGYEVWVRPNVVVVRDECHVQTVTLTARLVPSPAALRAAPLPALP
ncbi:MAG TPA: hypothetical protein PK788_11395 [Gemmatimonadaceae bacterium]|mgnify:CR=1 FL=1|nr:hypothetical protein [Gemmatimonadaceae bacterium]HRQ78369.1 hypothetical protein [Gemmatimonadaceae bacterium]